MSTAQKPWFITSASIGLRSCLCNPRPGARLQRGRDCPQRREAPETGRRSTQSRAGPSARFDRSEGAKAAIAAALARFGRIDVLINNAGYGIIGALEKTPEAGLRAVMETNFFGAMAVTIAALPILRAQRFEAIVNMSSLGGQLSFAGAGGYSASTFALEGASEALAQELAPFGIKVLIVEPGAFRLVSPEARCVTCRCSTPTRTWSAQSGSPPTS
jgi:NAD(P)-dependent dehydrogenase (short-subunit alcohol dehydrogenase family)